MGQCIIHTLVADRHFTTIRRAHFISPIYCPRNILRALIFMVERLMLARELDLRY